MRQVGAVCDNDDMGNLWEHALTAGRQTLACARRHPLALFVGELALVAACSAVFAVDSENGLFIRTSAFAVLGLAAAELAREGAVTGRPADRASRRPQVFWAAYVLVVGLIGGLAGLAAAGGAASDGVGAAAIASIVLMCVLTGVFEEGVFRVAAVEAFEAAFGDAAHAPLKAAALSAAVFGLLHVSSADAAAASSAVAWAQLAAKPVQAALFGFCLARAYQRTRSLWPLAAFHAMFDVLYLGPTMAATGSLSPTYVTGQPADLAVLVLATVLLIPAAIAAAKEAPAASR